MSARRSFSVAGAGGPFQPAITKYILRGWASLTAYPQKLCSRIHLSLTHAKCEAIGH